MSWILSLSTFCLVKVPKNDDNQLLRYNDYIFVFVALQNTRTVNQKMAFVFLSKWNEKSNFYVMLYCIWLGLSKGCQNGLIYKRWGIVNEESSPKTQQTSRRDTPFDVTSLPLARRSSVSGTFSIE